MTDQRPSHATGRRAAGSGGPAGGGPRFDSARREAQTRQVQDATDLVELIGEHVALKPQGREFVGLCPFHDDRKPSMNVSPAKQIYKCFSCGAGGDAFSFVMEYHKLRFPEAIEFLAKRAGIELESYKRGPAGRDDARDRIAKANEAALKFYQRALADAEGGAVARAYLAERGVSDEMVKAFALGYAPDGWEALASEAARRSEPGLKAFEEAGLIARRQTGQGHYDKLRHRLIFPICDAMGRPIAFGGRKIRPEDEPKYLNSPETALFQKGRTLYGLHLAKRGILDERTAVVVEGYTDVIACHQAGVTNVVAALGTAFTRDHMQALRRLADRVVLVFDADEAGQKAADRALELFLEGVMDVALVVLPGDLDPADLLQQPDGAAEWKRLVTGATDALDFQLDRFRSRYDAVGTMTGREKLAREYIDRLVQLGVHRNNPLRRSMIVARLAELMGMTADLVNRLIQEAQDCVRPSQAASRVSGAGGSSGGGSSPTAGSPSREAAGRSGRSTPAHDGFEDGPPLDQLQPPPDLMMGDGEPPAFDPDVAFADRASVPTDVVDGPASLGLTRAQIEIIGGLVRNADLFNLELEPGRTLDEAITPAEFVTPIWREAYQVLFDRLCDRQPVTLRSLTAVLAQGDEDADEQADGGDRRDWRGLVQRFIEAELAADQACGDDPERLTEMVLHAAGRLLRFHDELTYRASRSHGLLGAQSPTNDPQDGEALRRRLLRQVTEHCARPSATRIARLS